MAERQNSGETMEPRKGMPSPRHCGRRDKNDPASKQCRMPDDNVAES
jgi:hypothetical protein